MRDHPFPDTAAVRAAREVAEEYLSPALLAHSIRAWYWAGGFSVTTGTPAPDPELLAVAALLHDVGLAEPFDAVRTPYEIAGGHVARVLTAGAGWPTGRRDRVLEVIERHNLPSVDPVVDPEGNLLEIATGLDISGTRADVLPSDFLAEVLAAWPRGSLAAEFSACLVDQATRKPTSQAARLAAFVPDRLAHHPLDR